jgi:hypothetical protein
MEFTIGTSTLWTPERIYTNFETDRIFLMGKWSDSALFDVAAYPIRKVAYSTQTMEDDDYSAFFSIAILKKSCCLSRSIK